MPEIFHVDTQFLKNALGVFESLTSFERAARSHDAPTRASNVATLVDALDLCNLLVLGERVVYDKDVGGARHQPLLDQIDKVARSLSDSQAADMFRNSFGGVAPASEKAAWDLQLAAARDATAFFPRLARCATNVLDLFHLPHEPPTRPEEHLLTHVEARRRPSDKEIETIASKKDITGRRFYAALLSDETAFTALCDARERVELTEDVLAVLFMNFRLRLAEQRSVSHETVLVGDGTAEHHPTNALVYLPSMGRRDFTREFRRFIRWGSDPRTKNGHAFDLGLCEYVVEQWEGVGCQVQLSERRAIPIVVASVLGSRVLAHSHTPQTLLLECLRWKRENQKQIAAIGEATNEFEALDDHKRKKMAAHYVSEILKAPSTETARNRDLYDRLSMREGWLGLTFKACFNPLGTLENFVVGTTDKLKQHFKVVGSPEYKAATHLSEAARPLLMGVGPDVRQRLIDIFGGTVLDARNPSYDPDRFPAVS